MEREMEALIDKLCASVVKLCRNQLKQSDLDSREIAIEHRENCLKDRQLLLQEKVSLQNQLSERDTVVQQLRQEINKLTLERQTGIAAKDDELREVKLALDSAKAQCGRFAEQLEQLNKTIKENADSHARKDESYEKEVQCQARLAQFYKEAADEAECKVEELVSSLESLQQLYNDAKERNTILEFSNLPNVVLLKVFEYLPFEDCVCIGRTNRRLREISRIIISKTTDLDLTDPKFERLTPIGLASLVDTCKNNLEAVTLSENPQLAATFSEFCCPNLVFLDMDDVECGADVFGALIKNNQHLQRLSWKVDEPVKYPSDVVSEHLLELDLRQCDDASLSTLSGRCPNLKDLHVSDLVLVNGHIMDQFFANSSKLETVCIEPVYLEKFDPFIHFWRLPSLRNLNFATDMDTIWMENNFLVKISRSFPQLQSLALPYMCVTNTGISALTGLPNLCRLELGCDEENEIDTSVEKFAKWGKLEELIIRGPSLSMATLIKLIRFCPKMYYVCLTQVADTDATDDLIEQFRQVCSLPGQNITVMLFHSLPPADFTRIRDVFDEIANAGGRKISFMLSQGKKYHSSISPCP